MEEMCLRKKEGEIDREECQFTSSKCVQMNGWVSIQLIEGKVEGRSKKRVSSLSMMIKFVCAVLLLTENLFLWSAL